MSFKLNYPWEKDLYSTLVLRRLYNRFDKGSDKGGWFAPTESVMKDSSVLLPAATVKESWKSWNRERVRLHKREARLKNETDPAKVATLKSEIKRQKEATSEALASLEKSKRIAQDRGIKTDSRGNWKNKDEFAEKILESVGATINDRGEITINTTAREMEFIKSQGDKAWAEFTKRANQAKESTSEQLSEGFWTGVMFEKVARETGNADLLASAHRLQIEEFNLSLAASKYGYKAANMGVNEWAELGEKLKEDAYDKLKFASETQRGYQRQRLRGKKTDWMIVGKEHVLARSGVSKKDARKQVKAAWEQHKRETEEYTTQKLTEYGYPKDVLDTLPPSQHRKLLAEIGLGEVNSRASIKGLTPDDRRAVIAKASLRQRLDAYDTALSPGKAEGLEMWNNYVLASMRAGKEPEFPTDDVMTIESPPGYVTGKTAPGKPPKMPEDLSDLIDSPFDDEDEAPF